MKRALITGISGQDGSYLAELLLAKEYEVHGIVRREALEDFSHRLSNLKNVKDQITLHVAALDNHLSMHRVIGEVKPDEYYHLSAFSFSYLFEDESSILDINFKLSRLILICFSDLSRNSNV